MELDFRKAILLRLVLVAITSLHSHFASAAFGVNYGLLGDNLPTPGDEISMYKQEKIALLRLFEPKPEVLEALRGSGLKVSLGMKNEDVSNIASDVNRAIEWVKTNVAPYAKDVNFGWISVGNEMVPGPGAELIPKAMNNILSGLKDVGITGIKVTTAVHTIVLGVSYPPSAGEFNKQSKDVMNQIINWLRATNDPIMLNAYPYYALVSDPKIPLDYAMFNAAKPVIDGSYKYYSLFEATVDAFYAALEKNGWPGATVVVAETGWPTAGNEPYTSIQNAQTYNQKLVDKMKQNGTPRRPKNILDIFIFAMFNENQKPAGKEQHWGIHYPNKEHVYPLTF